MVKKRQYNEVTLSAVGTSSWIPLNPYVKPFEVSITGFRSADANLVYTAQYTVDNFVEITDDVDAIDVPEMIDLAVNITKTAIAPITGVRLKVTSRVAGSVTLKVRQSGVLDD
jgi:hypothetical protein